MNSEYQARIKTAWQGRISGCQLGKPVEMLSMRKGFNKLDQYLDAANSKPLRDYIPYIPNNQLVNQSWCKNEFSRSEPDDDINYSFLALLMLEQFGVKLRTEDVARTWLKLLPVGSTYTAERAAYKVMLEQGDEWFPEGQPPGFDLGLCANNPFNDWIGAQIRADVYGWVCPGNPELAAKLATADAELSHRGDGVYGAVLVAALGAALQTEAPNVAIKTALRFIPANTGAERAIKLGLEQAGDPKGYRKIHSSYEGWSPVHTLNNLALVIWALFSNLDDYSAAIGDVVSAGWDTDCNGATVGALWGLQGKPIPEHWIQPWQGQVGLSLAGYSSIGLEELVDRTVAVALELK